MKHFKLQSFKKTQDDWCPNYRHNTVRLFCCPLADGKFRVAAWGNDDFGMEFDYNTEKLARDMYEFLNRQKYINVRLLKDLGFKSA